MAVPFDPSSGSTRREWLTGVSAAMSASSAASAQTGGDVRQPNVVLMGLVAGKTQTNLPWDSWQKPYTDREPAMWFHDILYFDGKPYRPEEVAFIKQMTGYKGKRK